MSSNILCGFLFISNDCDSDIPTYCRLTQLAIKYTLYNVNTVAQ